jgi:hypothetical protein
VHVEAVCRGRLATTRFTDNQSNTGTANAVRRRADRRIISKLLGECDSQTECQESLDDPGSSERSLGSDGFLHGRLSNDSRNDRSAP